MYLQCYFEYTTSTNSDLYPGPRELVRSEDEGPESYPGLSSSLATAWACGPFRWSGTGFKTR